MRVSFDKLEESDLIVDCIYEGGPSNYGGEVLSKLLSTVNQGGFRKKPRQDDSTKFAYVGLEVKNDRPEWPNKFDAESGILEYYGDNKTPGTNILETNKKGNELLKNVFSILNSGESLKEIPPFLVFKSIGEGFSRKFLGLAVPGNPNIPPGEDLKTVWRSVDDERFVNYKATFTILDTGDEPIKRQWLENLIDGEMDNFEHAPKAWEIFVKQGREGIKALKAPTFCDYKHRNNGGVNELYYGVPGSGKSSKINKKLKNVDESNKERILFHPDYTYSDFVGQILPQIENDQILYKFTPGPFTEIVEKAFHDPKNDYYLIIEEINRGNAPAIFGDIFQLLDRLDDSNSVDEEGYAIGTSEFAITNSDIASSIYRKNEFDVYGNKFRIPSNLSIFATMNTSDQNVFALDTAFQRRWDMILVKNEIDDKKNVLFRNLTILDTGIPWKTFCCEINEKIIKENINLSSTEDKRLGTYFIKSKDFVCNKDDFGDDNNRYKEVLKEKSQKFSEKVLKYLWDDAFKFSRDKIFNTKEYDTLDKIITQFNKEDSEKERLKVFESTLYNKLTIEFDTNQGE